MKFSYTVLRGGVVYPGLPISIKYMIGGITLTCFLVQVATGFAMTFYYRPTVTEAFSSVQYIMTEANFGWLFARFIGVKIVTGVPEAIPLIGSPLVELLRGSASVGQSTLTRFYSLHTFVLPLLTAVFMLMHFLMIRKQGISGPL
ncbi:Cytochrome b6 [Rhynchospora pubera]|uniref:Cytochrome b6 n=1 Tax=Rhynchospora pubera TaxID=906938 RepID=A0AAV8B821_9POAL|nr:Cytochrome b6 [Rhynchospora pubera]